jgi:hypothetical protein
MLNRSKDDPRVGAAGKTPLASLSRPE